MGLKTRSGAWFWSPRLGDDIGEIILAISENLYSG